MSGKADRRLAEAHADATAVAVLLDSAFWRFGRGSTASRVAMLMRARKKLPGLRRAITAALDAVEEQV